MIIMMRGMFKDDDDDNEDENDYVGDDALQD